MAELPSSMHAKRPAGEAAGMTRYEINKACCLQEEGRLGIQQAAADELAADTGNIGF
jgi:hypothetical protein